ncbi:MAG: hypothetical protein WAN64_21200, partial [Pseudolabrys sp.]
FAMTCWRVSVPALCEKRYRHLGPRVTVGWLRSGMQDHFGTLLLQGVKARHLAHDPGQLNL